MAFLDKTYISDISEYVELKTFLDSFGEVTDDYGNRFVPSSYLMYTEEEVRRMIDVRVDSGESVYIAVMSTPICVDIWLIRNAGHIGWLQESLRERYDGSYTHASFSCPQPIGQYDKILERRSCYDNHERGGLGKRIRVRKDVFPVLVRKGLTRVLVEATVTFPCDIIPGDYDEVSDKWWGNREVYLPKGHWLSSHSVVSDGKYSEKALFRKLQKWNLPKDAVVGFIVWAWYGEKRYIFDFSVRIGKRRNRR